jgi:hypothetical protein
MLIMNYIRLLYDNYLVLTMLDPVHHVYISQELYDLCEYAH